MRHCSLTAIPLNVAIQISTIEAGQDSVASDTDNGWDFQISCKIQQSVLGRRRCVIYHY